MANCHPWWMNEWMNLKNRKLVSYKGLMSSWCSLVATAVEKLPKLAFWWPRDYVGGVSRSQNFEFFDFAATSDILTAGIMAHYMWNAGKIHFKTTHKLGIQKGLGVWHFLSLPPFGVIDPILSVHVTYYMHGDPDYFGFCLVKIGPHSCVDIGI